MTTAMAETMRYSSDTELANLVGEPLVVAAKELLATGPLMSVLVSGPTSSCWRFRFSRYANFVMVRSQVNFDANTPLRFGQMSRVRFNDTSADMLYKLWLVVKLPGLHPVVNPNSRRTQASRIPVYDPNTDRRAFHRMGRKFGATTDDATNVGYQQFLSQHGQAATAYDYAPVDEGPLYNNGRPWCHYSNSIGQLIVRHAILLVGTFPADQLTSDFLYMYEELTGQPGRRLREHVGKMRSREQLIEMSRSEQTLYIPMPFYFTKFSGSAYMLAAARNSPIEVLLDVERLERCIVRSSYDVQVLNASTKKPIRDKDIQGYMNITHVYLGETEQRQIAESNLDQLMTQTQISTTRHKGSRNIRIPLCLSHPVTQMMWAVRTEENEKKNNWFNYSGIGGREPIEKVAMRYDDRLRFGGEPASFFRLVTPIDANNNVPKGFIYNYSFAINAQDNAPNGASSPGIFSTVDFYLQLQKGLEMMAVTVIVCMINFNIMRYRDMGNNNRISAPLFR